MKKIIRSCFTFLVLISFNCKKENISEFEKDGLILTSGLKSERLVISSSSFKDLCQNIKTQVSEKGFSQPNSSLKNLYSLLNFETSISSEKMIETMDNYLLSGQKGNYLKTSDSLVYSIVISELIESDVIKSLVNVQGEVQVGDTLYKISPYGTLCSHIKDEVELREVYQILREQNDIAFRVFEPTLDLKFGDLSVSKSDPMGVNVINNKVYFTDTFRDEGPNPYRQPEETEDGGGGGGGGGGYSPPPPPRNDDPFSDMKEIRVNFREGILNIWDTFTRNRTEYRNFNNRYRISALFYNRNYFGFKSLGIKVKLQKKGLLWWNKTEAEEIIAGWERMAYKQTNVFPAFSRPLHEAPVFASPYMINPYEAPANGWFTQNYASLYEWHFAESSNELFSIVIPQYLLPLTDNDISIPSSELKPLVSEGWNKLKQILQRSVPMSGSGDPNNYKFPIHDLYSGRTRKLSINDMEKMPKAINSVPTARDMLFPGQKIRTYVSPYYERKKNVKKIVFDLDFSTATFKLSYNIGTPISLSNVLNSLEVSNLDDSYKVEDADVFGTVKHNGKWLGIRLVVKVSK